MLGIGWALVQPVFSMVIISVVFGNLCGCRVRGYHTLSSPMPPFSPGLGSRVPSPLRSPASYVSNMYLVTKIYFPREILPLWAILTRLVDFALVSLVFVGLMLWYRIPVSMTLLFVLLLLAIQILLALGISLLGAAISVFLRDISFSIPLGMQLWMYASPVNLKRPWSPMNEVASTPPLPR